MFARPLQSDFLSTAFSAVFSLLFRILPLSIPTTIPTRLLLHMLLLHHGHLLLPLLHLHHLLLHLAGSLHILQLVWVLHGLILLHTVIRRVWIHNITLVTHFTDLRRVPDNRNACVKLSRRSQH